MSSKIEIHGISEYVRMCPMMVFLHAKRIPVVLDNNNCASEDVSLVESETLHRRGDQLRLINDEVEEAILFCPD